MRLTKSRIWKFQNLIFDWWELNKRDLPWRYTHNPYNIFISEIMLQQTQVSRVIPKYEEFLYFFPDVYTLAQASPAQVLKVWKGMGYNRRALYLHKTAKIIDGFTPDQQFFLSAAHVWAQNIRPEQLRNLVTTDPHPPAKYRVNGTIVNMPEFKKAFEIPNSMTNNQHQCVIW